MTLCGFEIVPGEKQQVKLPVPGGAPLEAWMLCGAPPERRWWLQLGCMAVSMSAFWLCKN